MTSLSSVIQKIVSFITSPTVLFLLAILILVGYVLFSKTNFINIGKLFSDYFAVFSDARSQLLIFLGVPVLLAASTLRITNASGEIAESLIIFLSILISAFFSMLSILVTKGTEKNGSREYTDVLKQTETIVLFEIVLCVLSLIIMLTLVIVGTAISLWAIGIMSFLSYYLIFVMLINILILIKRLKSLIDNS